MFKAQLDSGRHHVHATFPHISKGHEQIFFSKEGIKMANSMGT
jgi:hypothetical protein